MDVTAQPTAESAYYKVSKPLGWTLLTLVVLSLTVSVLIVRRNRELVAADNQRLDSQMGPRIGATVAQMTGIDTSGTPLHITFGDDGRKTLLLVFTPECRLCRLNWPSWQMVANSINKKFYRMVYVNGHPGSTSEYLRQYQIPSWSTVIAEADPGVLIRCNITLTPETILLDTNGKIEKAWLGLLEGEQLSDVERSLGISESKPPSL